MTHPSRTRYAVEFPVGTHYRVGFAGYGDPALPDLDVLNIRCFNPHDSVFSLPYRHIDALIAGLQELRRVVSEGQEAPG